MGSCTSQQNLGSCTSPNLGVSNYTNLTGLDAQPTIILGYILTFLEIITVEGVVRRLSKNWKKLVDHKDATNSRTYVNLAPFPTFWGFESLSLNIDHLKIITLKYKRIQTLNLRTYKNLDSLELFNILLINCTKLKSLDIIPVRRNTFKVGNLKDTHKLYSQLHTIKCEVTNEHNNIVFFYRLFQNLPNLKVLHLTGIIDDSLIRSISRNCPILHTVYLNECSVLYNASTIQSVTDEGMSLLFTNCKNIHNLTLGGCRLITNKTFYELNKLKHLKRLGVYSCSKVTSMVFIAVAQRCPLINYVSMDISYKHSKDSFKNMYDARQIRKSAKMFLFLS